MRVLAEGLEQSTPVHSAELGKQMRNRAAACRRCASAEQLEQSMSAEQLLQAPDLQWREWEAMQLGRCQAHQSVAIHVPARKDVWPDTHKLHIDLF